MVPSGSPSLPPLQMRGAAVREPLHLLLPDRQGQGWRSALGGPSCWMGREACGWGGRGPWKMNGCRSWSGAAACRVCAWIPRSRGGNLLLSLLGIRQACEGEMAEQLGAQAAPITEPSAG